MKHLAGLLDVRLPSQTDGHSLVWDATLRKFVPGAVVSKLPAWIKYTVGFAALSTAGLTNNIELFSLPAKVVIHAVIVNPTEAFTGGLISAYTLSVGIAGSLTKYCTAVSVFAAAPQAPQQFMGMESVSGATSIKVAAVAVTGLLNTASAGSADIYVMTSVLP